MTHTPAVTVSAADTPAALSVRIPCRGCLPQCTNYATCQGRPWRQQSQPLDSMGKW